jgi:hypothetical protein
MSNTSQTDTTKQATTDGDIGISAGQLMGVLQLGIFLPFLGPLLMIAIGAMNRKSKDGRMMMWGGVALIMLQLATAALVYGYYVSHRIPAGEIQY